MSLPQKARLPLWELLLRATVWTPVVVVLSGLWLAAWTLVLVAPFWAALLLYERDWLSAAIWVLGAVPVYFLARFLHGRLWEDPPSVL